MRYLLSLLAIPCVWLLVSCDHPVRVETRVQEDGSFDKAIVFEKTDSSVLRGNVFGIGEAQGWATRVEVNASEKKEERYRIRFEKHFNGTEDMNAELNTDSDTLFHIRSSWKKELRWFYTFIRYEETYTPLNRFKGTPAEDFVTDEDRLFIKRLPPYGAEISNADSIFLKDLDEKIKDKYAMRAIFNEQMAILRKLMAQSKLEQKWLDTLSKREKWIFRMLEDDSKSDKKIAVQIADTLGIPLPPEANRWADSLSADFDARLRFMTYVTDCRLRVVVEMPWSVVETNADSVAGNHVYWRPRIHKFMFSDYTLYAEARVPNKMAMLLGALLMVVTLFVLFRKGILRNRT